RPPPFGFREKFRRDEWLRLLRCGIAEPDAFDDGAYPEFQGTDVVHVVYLQQCEAFAVALQYVARFVQQKGVGPAAERSGLYEVYVLPCRRPVRRPQDAVDVAPLRD